MPFLKRRRNLLRRFCHCRYSLDCFREAGERGRDGYARKRGGRADLEAVVRGVFAVFAGSASSPGTFALAAVSMAVSSDGTKKRR